MWYFLKFLGFLFKLALAIVLLAGLALLAALYIADRGIPDDLVQAALNKLPPNGPVLRVGHVSYKLGRGLVARDLKLFPPKAIEAAPIATVSEATLRFSILPHTPLAERIQELDLSGLSLPELPPDNPAAAKPFEIPKNFRLPSLAPFKLNLSNVSVLGIHADRLQGYVSSEHPALSLSGLDILLPDPATGGLHVRGDARLDLAKLNVTAKLAGQAYPQHILPLLRHLNANGAVRQIEPFSDFAKPVTATYALDIELRHADFAMDIGVDVADCTYHRVPYRSAKGDIRVTETNRLITVDIGPVDARSLSGPLAGTLAYRSDTETLLVNAKASMEKDHLLNTLDILNHGELDLVQCSSNIDFAVQGLVAISATESKKPNDLSGRLSWQGGTLLRMPIGQAGADLVLKGYTAAFNDCRIETPGGGRLAGRVTIDFPGYSATNTTFAFGIACTNALLAELLPIAKVTNAVPGRATGRLDLSGHLSGPLFKSFNGQGRAKVTDSVISRLPLFAGFTDWMAKNIPGVSTLVTQSDISGDYAITNGIVHSGNLVIDGAVFGLACHGTYDIDLDRLDMLARAKFFRTGTVKNFITSLFTAPITYTLLEFKVFGPIGKPDWQYRSVIEKITDTLTDSAAKKKSE